MGAFMAVGALGALAPILWSWVVGLQATKLPVIHVSNKCWKIMVPLSQLWTIITMLSLPEANALVLFAAGCLHYGWCALSFEDGNAFAMDLVLLLLWQEQYHAAWKKLDIVFLANK